MMKRLKFADDGYDSGDIQSPPAWGRYHCQMNHSIFRLTLSKETDIIYGKTGMIEICE